MASYGAFFGGVTVGVSVSLLIFGAGSAPRAPSVTIRIALDAPRVQVAHEARLTQSQVGAARPQVGAVLRGVVGAFVKCGRPRTASRAPPAARELVSE